MTFPFHLAASAARPWVRLSGLAALAALASCAIPLGGPSAPQPSAEAVAACNSRADEEYLRQHSDTLYKADDYQTSQRDSPYAGQGLPETSAGLSAQYERNEDVKTCLNGTADPITPGPAAVAAPAP